MCTDHSALKRLPKPTESEEAILLIGWLLTIVGFVMVLGLGGLFLGMGGPLILRACVSRIRVFIDNGSELDSP